MLYNRAKVRINPLLLTFHCIYRITQGLLLIGAVFKSTVPDETDEERRELERYVTLQDSSLGRTSTHDFDCAQYGRRGCCREVETSPSPGGSAGETTRSCRSSGGRARGGECGVRVSAASCDRGEGPCRERDGADTASRRRMKIDGFTPCATHDILCEVSYTFLD